MPRAEIGALKAARLGAMRVPEAEGGFGASLPELFALLIELSASDTNITQALRGHFGFVEDVVSKAPGADRQRWTARLATGDLAGNAWTEVGEASQAAFSTRVSTKDGRNVLNGRKFYTTGSLFADWIDVGATNTDDKDCSRAKTVAVIRCDIANPIAPADQRMKPSGRVRIQQ